MKTTYVRGATGSRRGFALVTVILVIAVLATLVAAGFATLGSERRTSEDSTARADAFTIAQGGLESFLANASGAPDSSETVTVAVDGGIAYVNLLRVRTDATPAGKNGYIIWSRGVDTSARLTGTAQAERTVAQYAIWKPGSMKVMGSWTSLVGVTINGGSATIDGKDECGMEPDLPGMVVPNGTYVGKTSVLHGDPPLDDSRTEQQMMDEVNMDWEGLSDGSALPPGTIIVNDVTTDWPPKDLTKWPVVYVDGDLVLPKDGGQGLLIVTGNLTSNGTEQWHGIVLVGKDFLGNGTKNIHGTIMTGLNAKLPPPQNADAGTGDTGNGTKNIVYNSCDVAQTLQHLGALVPLTNAWVDNWPSYSY